jgi:hypothetical protein
LYASASAIVPFLLVSLPATYKVVRSLVGGLGFSPDSIASADGCPTGAGLLLHSAVFFGLVVALMFISKEVNKSHHKSSTKTWLHVLPYLVLVLIGILLVFSERRGFVGGRYYY